MKKIISTLALFILFFTAKAQSLQPDGNKGLYFDGINDQVKCPIILLNAFTIEFWIKTTQTGQPTAGTEWFHGFGLVDADGSTNDYGVSLANGKIVAGIGDNVLPLDFSLTSSASVNDGAWHHVAVTRAGNAMQIYIDGVSSVLASAGGVTTALGVVPLTIGSLQNNSHYFNGQLDEVRISSSVIYTTNFTPTASYSGGLLNYNFNEANGQAVLNSGTFAAGNGILGTNSTTESSDPLRAIRVRNTSVSGMGSLTQALTDANANPDKNYIDFSIFNAGGNATSVYKIGRASCRERV